MAEAHRLILSVCASLSVVLLFCCLGMWTQRGRPSCLLPGRKTPGQARVVVRDRTLHNGLHYDTWCAARRSTLRLLFIAQRARSGVELIYVPQSAVTGGGVEGGIAVVTELPALLWSDRVSAVVMLICIVVYFFCSHLLSAEAPGCNIYCNHRCISISCVRDAEGVDAVRQACSATACPGWTSRIIMYENETSHILKYRI